MSASRIAATTQHASLSSPTRSLTHSPFSLSAPFRATHRYGGRLFGISINIGTLLQETNLGSTRWLRTAKNLPSAAKPVRPPSPSPPATSPSGVVVRSGGAAVSVSGGKPESFRAAEYLAKTLSTGEPSDDFAA